MTDLDGVVGKLDGDEVSRTMKPMMAACVKQAVVLALVDMSMWVGNVYGAELNRPEGLKPEDLNAQRHCISGGFPSVLVNRDDAGLRHPEIEPFTIYATEAEATLAKLAEEQGIELMGFEERVARGGWIESEIRHEYDGFTTFRLDGDDRWDFHIPDKMLIAVERYPTDAERRGWAHSPDSMNLPFDVGALARNVGVRLLGSGGWDVVLPDGSKGYTGNMTTREVFEHSFLRPDRDEGAELGAALGGQGWVTGPIDPDRPLDEQRPEAEDGR